MRSPAADGELADAIAELKETVMTEQRQLRAFIRGLRTGKPISLHDLSRDCGSLCELLSRQWGIGCTSVSEAGQGWVPLRMQLDVQQLIREAVANAVRHGGASDVTISLAGDEDRLRLTVTDNGKGFEPPAAGKPIPPPASLNARVREARGTLEVQSAAGATSVIIRLPLEKPA